MSPHYQIPGRVPEDGVQRQVVSNYWRERFTGEPYYDKSHFFEDYEPAYQLGHASRAEEITRAYEVVEAELESRWAHEHGQSKLSWAQARNAVRRGWEEALAIDAASGRTTGNRDPHHD